MHELEELDVMSAFFWYTHMHLDYEFFPRDISSLGDHVSCQGRKRKDGKLGLRKPQCLGKCMESVAAVDAHP